MMTNDANQSFGSPESIEIPNRVIRDFPTKEPEVPRERKAEDQLDKLPRPTGYRVLIVPYTQPPRSKGGILLAETTLKTEELATTIGYVIALGPDCYLDVNKFPDGKPWCKPKDYVMFGRYAGARIVMQGENNDDLPLRLINDDEILAVVENPEDYVGVK